MFSYVVHKLYKYKCDKAHRGGTAAMIDVGVQESVAWAQDRLRNNVSVDEENEVEYRFVLPSKTVAKNIYTFFASLTHVRRTVFYYLQHDFADGRRLRTCQTTGAHSVVYKDRCGVHKDSTKRFIVAHSIEKPAPLSTEDLDAADYDAESRVVHTRHIFIAEAGFEVHLTFSAEHRSLEIEVSLETQWDELTKYIVFLCDYLQPRKPAGIMPVALKTLKQLKDAKEHYLLSLKYDGVRVVLAAYKGWNFVTVTDRANRLLRLLLLDQPAKRSFCLDAEYLDGDYIVFDCIHVNNAPSNAFSLVDRLALAKHFIDSAGIQAPVLLKRFHALQDFDKANDDRPRDGYIFTSDTKTLKWKPTSRQTIDFRLRRLPYKADTEPTYQLLYVDKNGSEIALTPYTLTHTSPYLDGVIAECRTTDENTFEMVGVRDDKDVPNFVAVVEDVMACLANPLGESELRTFCMRQQRKKKT